MKYAFETAEIFGTYIYNIRLKQMKHMEYILETFECSHCNIRFFYNIKMKHMKHTDETRETYV
jgi:hypothetical protein